MTALQLWFAAYKAWIYVAIGGLLIVGTVWTIGRVYGAGFNAGKAEGDRAIAAATAKANERQAADERAYRALSDRFVKLDHALARKEAEQRVETIERVRTVREYVQAHPSFSSITRPADFERVRESDFARLRAAAEASRLPGNGVARLPVADTAGD